MAAVHSAGNKAYLAGCAGLAILIVCLPFTHLVLLRSAAFILAVGTAAWLYGAGRMPVRLPLRAAFVLWVVAAGLSLLSLPAPMMVLNQIWNEPLKGGLGFATAFILASRRGNEKYWFIAAALGMAALALAGIVTWWPQREWREAGLTPALGDYNTSVLTLLPLVALPLFSGWRADFGRAALPLAIIAILLGLLAGALTLSRGFWLIAGLFTTLASIGYHWKMGFNVRKVLGVLLLLLSLFLVLAYVVAQSRGMELLRFHERAAIYQPLLQHLLDTPWNGFGYGHESQRAWYLANMTERGVTHAHNLTLSYIEQMGLLGLAVLVAVFGGLARQFAQYLGDRDACQTSLAALGLAMVIALFVRNNLDIFFVRQNLLLFFLVSGVMLGMLASRKASRA